jgi:L-lactate dehydrogenase complex protein LldG
VTTRAEFFQRIRGEMRRTAGLFPAAVADRPARPELVAETLRRELSERWPETLDRFRREFERVGGDFHRVAHVGEVPALVATLARARGGHRAVTWHPAALGVDLAAGLAGHGLEATVMPPAAVDDPGEQRRLRETIAHADFGVTGVDLAVAETGSLVLLSGAGRPRSTSLLPPYHVAVFDAGALVESLQQVGVFLEAWHGAGSPPWRGGVVNVITGPSRTADIELTLTRGVHGPKEVHAVFVDTRSRG